MKKERNYGIDLLRIISMLFVVVLHTLGRGGILDSAAVNSVQYKIGWFLEICAYCAVDIFALISGYVAYTGGERRTNYSRYFTMWLQVVFYGLLVTLSFHLIRPALVTKKNYLKCFLPVTTDAYWYFTAYTGLFILMPLLNKMLLHCSDKTLRKAFVAIFLVFSVFGRVTKHFELGGGYSFVWLVLLYILGGIMKKCEIGKHMKPYQAFIGIFLLNTFTYLFKIHGFEVTAMQISITKAFFVSYISPTILGAAILFVIAFSKIKFHAVLQKIIGFAAPAAFSIYLLNNQKFVWDYVIKGRFAFLANQPVLKMVFIVLLFAVVFAAGAILIDRIRIFLFKLCRVDKLTKKAAEAANKFITKVTNLL